MTLSRRSSLKPGKPPRRRKPLASGKKRLARGKWAGPAAKKRRAERRKVRRARQFGDDGYREEILATACIVSGRWPVDPAHVVRTRGAGAGPEAMAPLHREVHDDFDSLPAGKFERKWKRSKADIRAWARVNYAAWVARREQERERVLGAWFNTTTSCTGDFSLIVGP